MPELPEVETTRRGIAPHITGQRIAGVVVRQARLRWPVPPRLGRSLTGQRIRAVARRAKYLLLHTDGGTLIVHLGMSGSLRILPADTPPGPHDHVDLLFADGRCLRLRDPRRFGAVLWTVQAPERHPLLAALGPEPLGEGFSGEYLYAQSRGRRVAVKNLLMDSRVVVGVGNIYANEALFLAGINPHRAAGRISLRRYEQLAGAVRTVLEASLQAGGTTLRDFTSSSGEPGYFKLQLNVYDRAGAPCPRCGTPVAHSVLGQRSTYYCPRCQRS